MIKYYRPEIYVRASGLIDYDMDIQLEGTKHFFRVSIHLGKVSVTEGSRYYVNQNCMRLKELPKPLKEYCSDPFFEIELRKMVKA